MLTPRPLHRPLPLRLLCPTCILRALIFPTVSCDWPAVTGIAVFLWLRAKVTPGRWMSVAYPATSPSTWGLGTQLHFSMVLRVLTTQDKRTDTKSHHTGFFWDGGQKARGQASPSTLS